MAGIRESVVNLILRGRDLLTPAAKSASKGLDELQQSSEGLRGALRRVSDTQSQAADFRKLQERTDDTRKAWARAQRELRELSQQIEQTTGPTRRLERQFEKAQKNAQGAKAAFLQNREELDRLGQSLRAAGVDTDDLENEQQALTRRSEELTAELRQVDAQLEKQGRSAEGAARGTEQAGGAAGQAAGRFGRLGQALRRVTPSISQIRTGINAAGRALVGYTAAIAASIGTLTAFSRRQGRAAKEIANTAQALGVSARTVQVWRLAAQGLGLSADKATDVIKDMADKIGDFAATGGGEAADVFERLNLSIEDFSGLAADQQLIKLASAISEVNSKSEQIFFLESIADDASLLQPLLENNAAALRRVAAEAEAQGAFISPEQLVQLQRANEIFERVERRLKGVGNTITAAVAPALGQATENLVKLFQAGEGGQTLADTFRRMAENFRDFTRRLSGDAGTVQQSLQGIIDTAQFLGNGFISVFRGLQTAVSGAVTVVAGVLSAFLTQIQAITFGLNQLGIVSDSAFRRLSASAEAARDTTVSLAKQTADFGAKAVQAGRDAAAAFDNSRTAAQREAEALRERERLADELLRSGADLADQIGEVADESGRSADAARAARERLVEMGVDAGLAFDGIGDGAREAIDGLEQIATDIQQIGTESEGAARAFEQGMRSALQEISTAEEFKAIRQQIAELRDQDLIDPAQAAQALGLIRERQQEVNEQRMSDSVDQFSASVEEATAKTRELNSETRNTGDTAEGGFRKAVSAGKALSQMVDNAKAAMAELSQAALILFKDRALGLDRPADEATRLRNEISGAAQEISDLARSPLNFSFTGIGEFIVEMDTAAAVIRKTFAEQKLAALELREEIDSGSISLQKLNQEASRLDRNFDLLDQQSLDQLRSEIAAAQQQLEGLNESSEDTLRNLQKRLAELRGDTARAQEIEFQAERERLQQQLEEAQDAGAREAARNLQESIQQLERIQDIERQRREEAEAERRREAEARREEEEQARRAQRQQATTTNRQQTVAPPAGQRIVLQAPSGQDVEVTTTDPDGLLAALEQAGLRSV